MLLYSFRITSLLIFRLTIVYLCKSRPFNKPLQEETNTKNQEDQIMSTENSDSHSDSSISKVEIPKDDLVVQILARLDGPAYNQALYQDANTINQKFLAPPSFPWSGK